mgnify:CR=1 FL=1
MRRVVVLGMHRSGTSAVARYLCSLGGFVGRDDDLMPARPDNPLGFYERVDTAALNDDVLEAAGVDWSTAEGDLATRFSAGQFERFRMRARAIVEGLDGAGRFPVLKDPRLALTLPVWRTALGECAWIVSARDARDVASSLIRRNGFTRTHALALCESYLTSITSAVAGEEVLVVSYERLLEHTEAECGRIRAYLTSLGVAVEEPSGGVLESAIRPELRNEVSALGEEEVLPAGLAGLEARLSQAGREPGPVVLPVTEIGRHSREVLELARQAVGNRDRLRELEIHHRRLVETLERRYDELFQRREGEIAALEKEISVRQREIADRDREIDRLVETERAAQGRRDLLLANAARDLDEQRRGRDLAVTESTELRGEVGRLERLVEQCDDAKARLRNELRSTTAELEAALAVVKDLEASRPVRWSRAVRSAMGGSGRSKPQS